MLLPERTKGIEKNKYLWIAIRIILIEATTRTALMPYFKIVFGYLYCWPNLNFDNGAQHKVFNIYTVVISSISPFKPSIPHCWSLELGQPTELFDIDDEHTNKTSTGTGTQFVAYLSPSPTLFKHKMNMCWSIMTNKVKLMNIVCIHHKFWSFFQRNVVI